MQQAPERVPEISLTDGGRHFSKNDLRLGQQLGSGEFGLVFYAMFAQSHSEREAVAVKMLKGEFDVDL